MARRVEQRSHVVRAAYRAHVGGARQRSIVSMEWDVARKCEAPVYVGREGRDRKTRQKPVWLDVYVPCRKCPACLRARSARWRHRAERELKMFPRTWFGTLTLNPQAHYLMECRATRVCEARGGYWPDLTSAERFTAIHAENSRELTLWLKRVRAASGAALRYLLVAEAHKSGLPHYHVLIHELFDHAPVRKQVLQDQWKLGFTNFKLVDDSRASAYVCKYLAKSALARVRASLSYGNYDPVEQVIRRMSVNAKRLDPPSQQKQITTTCSG